MPNSIDQYIEIARCLWVDEVNQRRRTFLAERQTILEQFVRRGLVPSGLLDGRLRDHAYQELRLRGLAVVRVFEDVLKNASIPLGANEQRAVNDAARMWLSGQADDLAQTVRGTNVPGDPGRSRPEYAQLGLHQVEGRVNAEVARIFLAHADSANRPAAVTVNAQNIGAVQTGAGASAVVNQSITDSNRDHLRAAVDALTEAVGRLSDGVPSATRDEIVILASDLKVEIARDQPRQLQLLKYASALAVAIQTVAALQPAHALLKGALLPFGINLP